MKTYSNPPETEFIFWFWKKRNSKNSTESFCEKLGQQVKVKTAFRISKRKGGMQP